MNDRGKPPKSAEEIQSQLDSIRQTANVACQKGPINEHNQDGRQIVVASFFDRELGRKFQSELSRRGLFSNSTIENRKMVISVDFPDAKVAGQVSKKFRAQFPDCRRPGDASRYDLMIFGSLIGLVTGMTFAIGADYNADTIAFVIATFGIGTATGHLADRVFVTSPRNRFGLWEFLVAVGILGMAVIAMHQLPLLF